ncbi:cation:proton antiporter [Novosphingobium sp.]|uniref:cation:proton antiporter n=1 Tax=Novosphingobium sp. TaxID=1874826 RepID=UPI0035B355EA
MTSAPPISELFLLALIVIFALPYLVWRLGRTDYFAPLVVVQIVTGILLGPGVLGAAFPGFYTSLFTPGVIGALNGIAWWAVMLFVFVAGLELDLSHAWEQRRETGMTASLAFIVPFALSSLAALAIHALFPGWVGRNGTPLQFVLGIGMACAVTALPILVLFLERLGILRLPFGQRILRYASLEDIFVWGVLALVLADWERAGRQIVFFLSYLAVAWAMRKLMRALALRDRWYVALIWLAAIGYWADWSGLHFMVGAFLAGAVLEAEWFGIERVDAFRDTVLLALMPVFFLSTGLKTSWEVGSGAVFLGAALLLLSSVAGKLLGVGLAGKLLGWGKGEAWVIGWLLQTKALIMIIFVNILFDKQLISSGAFTALLLAAVGSTMLTIPAVTPALRLLDEVKRKSA